MLSGNKQLTNTNPASYHFALQISHLNLWSTKYCVYNGLYCPQVVKSNISYSFLKEFTDVEWEIFTS